MTPRRSRPASSTSSFPTEATDGYAGGARPARAARRRARASASSSQPRSVAVVGASREPGTIGAALLDNLTALRLHAGRSTPSTRPRQRSPACAPIPRVGAIGAAGRSRGRSPCPPRAVEEVVADCARAGVRGVVVISAGFRRSVGREGAQRSSGSRDLVRGSGMRMVGPELHGRAQHRSRRVAERDVRAARGRPPGNVGDALAERRARARDPRLRARRSTSASRPSSRSATRPTSRATTCSPTGPTTRARASIVLYLESFGNPRKFARIAPEVARRKPIVAVKSGRSAAGTRAASSHSAALASLDVAVDALFEQAGRDPHRHARGAVRRRGAARRPSRSPRGPRVGVVTNAGGPGHPARRRLRGARPRAPALAAGDARGAARASCRRRPGSANPIDMIAVGDARAVRAHDRGRRRRSRRRRAGRRSTSRRW